MRPPVRPTLTLPGRGLVDAVDDRPLEVASYDVQLPCRRFRIEHKVALLGRVSLTAEFLLRLVRSLDGVAEDDAAAFFGFDRREGSYVLNEVVTQSFVERRDGRLWLSAEGHSLFRDGSGQPEIFAVESRVDSVGFDLLSLAPERWRFQEAFDFRLPELRLPDDAAAGSATARVPASFRRFYARLPDRRVTSGERRSLYSIGQVVAGERFSTAVKLTLVGTGLRPSHAEADLSEWRAEHEQDERPEVVAAVASFREGLLVSRRPDDDEAYRRMADLAPEFLSEFVRPDGFAVERYYREAYGRAGEPRVDRPTIPLLGSLLLRSNVERFVGVLGYGLRNLRRPPRQLLWLAPQVPLWGSTRTLPDLLRQVASRLVPPTDGEGASPPPSVCLLPGRGSHYLDEAFDRVVRTDASVIAGRLEILLIPETLVAVAVHAPVGMQVGLPLPLGILSFDPKVIERTGEHVADLVGQILPADAAASLLQAMGRDGGQAEN